MKSYDASQKLNLACVQAIEEAFGHEVSTNDIVLQHTRKDFDGQYTLVTFPFTRYSRLSPEETGKAIGEVLRKNCPLVQQYNTVKGFLNLEIEDQVWLDVFTTLYQDKESFSLPSTGKKVVLEYCGPNTNKPLHLGHIRNMLIGYASANLLSRVGHQVHKVNIYNDRGIAICKSMVAWKHFGEGKTPETTQTKGDHFVGEFYVAFDQAYKKEVEELMAEGKTKEEAENNAPLLLEARSMLRQWEKGDQEVINLWNMMNSWVYDGFEQTFSRLGVDFEKHYKESDYYQDGKRLVEEGLQQGIYTQREDGSIWVDLTKEGLDEKLLLRGDGTSVYITQDMGIAEARYQDFGMDRSVYVVANEQDYHFKVLKLVLEKLGKPYGKSIFHLSYGMVDLPSGRMKSREGTVVDADELLDEMVKTACQRTEELGKVDDLSPAEAETLYHTLALSALKYFILKVNPKKRVIFNPEDSIDFQGHTGPFIQYTYVRTRSVLRRYEGKSFEQSQHMLHETERDVIILLHDYCATLQRAADADDVSIVAEYAYQVARAYSKLWSEVKILNEEDENLVAFRVALSRVTGEVLADAMSILGITMPERM